MTKYFTLISTTLLLLSGMANAAPVKTGQQAATLCKAHLKGSIDGLKTLKYNKIRSSKGKHTISFSVVNQTERYKTKCIVNSKDGSITISKK